MQRRIKDKLRTDKPSRALCLEAEYEIRKLEDVLIEIETSILIPERKLKESLLKHVQRALYTKESFEAFYNRSD